jgi:hypothetical protein
MIINNPNALAATVIPDSSGITSPTTAAVTVASAYTCGDPKKFVPDNGGSLVCSFDLASATPTTPLWSSGKCNPVKASVT